MKRKLCLILAMLFILLCGCSSTPERVVWRATEHPTSQEDSSPEPVEEDYHHDDGLEYAIFPMEYLHITQTAGEGTHACNHAVDLAGVDGGIDEFFAPFTLQIVRLQKGYNLVWAQSTQKVHLADGSLDYVTFLLEHDDDIDDLYVGQVIPQGEVFYAEGTAGNASGNHVHAEFAKGRYVNQGSYHAEDGRVSINNGTSINEILFLTSSTIIDSDDEIGGYTWQALPLSTEEILASGYHCEGEGHFSDKITELSAPTCTQEGSYYYVCKLCGQTVTEAVPALGHTAEKGDAIRAGSEKCGAIHYSCSTCKDSWLELEWVKNPTCQLSDAHSNPYIAYVTQNDLMQPYEDDRFFPDGYFSRIELLTILFDLGGQWGYYCDYSDVDSDIEHIVAWATAKDMAHNTEGERFAPDTAVTRLDAITMIVNFMEEASVIGTSDPAKWAVVSGMYSSEDNLDCVMTRAEVAKLLTLMKILPTL